MRSIKEIKDDEKIEKLNHSDPRMNLMIKSFTGYHITPDNMALKEEYSACAFCGEKKEDEGERYEFSGKTVCRSCAESITGGSFE